MTAHRTPDISPVLAGIYACRNSPVNPGSRATFNTINKHDQFTENRHISCESSLCLYSIVQLGHEMWCNMSDLMVARICRAKYCCSGKLRDSDMIRVAIKSIRPERNDHTRTNDLQQRDDFSDNLCIFGLIEIAIKIVQKCEMPSISLASRNSLSRMVPSAVSPGCSSLGPRQPRSPRVATTREVSTPSRAYFASVPPIASDSSSGWAMIHINFS